MLKQKGVKAIIISLLIILSTTCFSLLFTNVYKTFTKEEPQAATYMGAYCIPTDINILANNYDNYTRFCIIKDRSGVNQYTVQQSFDAFIEFLSKGDAFGITDYFKDKTVTLYGSVALAYDKPINKFAGTFDGNGNSISISATTDQYLTIKSSGSYGAVFNEISSGAIIKNLEIKNVKFYAEWSSNNLRYFGGIAGTNNGTIESCIVNGFKVFSEVSYEHCRVAPLAGTNNGTIKNCMVKGNYSIDCNEIEGVASNYFVCAVNEATDCIFATTVSELHSYAGLKTPSENGDDAIHINYRNYGSATSAYSSSVLDMSDSATGSSVWYKYASSSYGFGKKSQYCVYLRAFMDWETVFFTAGDNGTINLTSATVPSDYVDTIGFKTTNVTNDTLTLYNSEYEVLATPNAGYQFASWVDNGDNSYTATFNIESYKIKFKSVTFDDRTISPSVEEIIVKYGDIVSCYQNLDEMDMSNSRYQNCYAMYTLGSSDVKYDLGECYQISDWGKLGGSNISTLSKIPDLGANGATIEVTPTISYITYTLSFSTPTGATYSVKKDSSASTDTSATVIRGTQPTYNSSTATFTFKGVNVSGLNQISYEVAYTLSNELYEITGGSSPIVNSNSSITITTRQVYKYIVFNKAKIGENESSYTATLNTDNLITTSNTTYPYKVEIGESITGTMPSDGINNQTLTYEGSKAFATYSGISAIYRLSSAGISNGSDTITITPVLEENYVIVNFQTIAASKTTDGIAIGASGGNSVYSVLMDKSEKTLGASLSGNEIRLTYKLDGVEQTVTYNISTLKNMYYINTSNIYTMEESGTPRSVNVEIPTKTYTITFG